MRYALALMAAMLTAPAVAQDEPRQTVAGAHRFLALVTGQGGVSTFPTRHTWPQFGAKYWVTLASEGECATRVEGRVDSYNKGGSWINAGTPQFKQKTLDFLLATNGLRPPPYSIDWSRVASITTVNGVAVGNNEDPGKVIVITTSTNRYVQFLFPNADITKRVRYAMEFLKTACDKTAETGF